MRFDVVVVGAGFTGLSAAWELSRAGLRVAVLESEATPGGLAGTFDVGGVQLEKFYHHWFTSDADIDDLASELGVAERIHSRAASTGTYFANATYRLATPGDLLAFPALPPLDRLRLGWLALRARSIRDWRSLESMTAREWLIRTGGRRVFHTIWEPLLRAKFGGFAGEIGAVWMWNKLALRGGSRDASGREILRYFDGGFGALAAELTAAIERLGGVVRCNEAAIRVDERAVTSAVTRYETAAALVTTPLPVAADLLCASDPAYAQRLRAIRYLANICIVLELKRSLGDLYWTNVSDPSFPFTCVIEHTNFQPARTYGRHIVYISRYLPADDPAFLMDDGAYAAFALTHLRRMFTALCPSDVLAAHVWRAPFAQPVVDAAYAARIPPNRTPLPNVYLCSMAQIYPQDRGTNYAVRSGRAVARSIASALDRTTILS